MCQRIVRMLITVLSDERSRLMPDTLMDALGINAIKTEKHVVEMTMPVDGRTRQPAGCLHGGASVALADTAESDGAALDVSRYKFNVFGIEINATHNKSKRDGTVTAKAVALHVGRTTMVWEVKITDETENLICVSRCTIGIVPKKH